MRQNIFMAVALLIGLGLIVLSFYLTPLVEKKSTDRAKQATRGVQILGVAIFCISATKLTCQGSHSNFNILLGIMFLLGAVCTGLFSIIHNDCVDARTFTPYALGVSVCIMIGSFIGIIVHIRKIKIIKESEKPRYVVSEQEFNKLALEQEDSFQNDDIDSESSTETTPDTSQLRQKEIMEHLLQGYKPTQDKDFPRYDKNDISKRVEKAESLKKLFKPESGNAAKAIAHFGRPTYQEGPGPLDPG